MDEEELDAEINKSALINLVEGALVEGVRKGASDIHFIPKSGHKTEILIRIDGTLATMACSGKHSSRSCCCS
ncbi:MAG: hypothetical protein MZV64_69860 [Ignavibacteriales bacterium]|nr:hypothetical protein [Ignavibacteriales bacterium]